jgi:hypothetical protein
MFNFFKTHSGTTAAKSATGRLYSFAAPLLPLAAAAAEVVTPVAETKPKGTILFDNIWLALAVILSGVALLTTLVALLGRYLARTHPDSLNNTTK